MDQKVDARLKKGARVRLNGLTTQVLNGAEGKIVDFPDASTGRFPIVITSPPEAVAAFKDGVKVRPQNLEPLAPAPSERRAQEWKQRQEEAAKRFPHRSVEGRPFGGPSSVGRGVHQAVGGPDGGRRGRGRHVWRGGEEQAGSRSRVAKRQW